MPRRPNSSYAPCWAIILSLAWAWSETCSVSMDMMLRWLWIHYLISPVWVGAILMLKRTAYALQMSTQEMDNLRKLLLEALNRVNTSSQKKYPVRHTTTLKQHEFFWGEHQGSYMKAVCEVQHLAASPSRPTVVDSKMPQQVLKSLFKVPEQRTCEHEPSKMDWKKVVKKLQSYNHPITANKQERQKNGDGYQEFRGVAARHYDAMKGYYQKAALAYSKGDKSYASYLAEEGKHCRELGRKEDEKASREIFEARNKHITNTVTVDLHGQHVKQAMKLLKVHMLVCVCMPSTLLRVITGCGVEGTGKGKIKRAVMELVEREHIEWYEGNSGTIVLRLGGPREYRFLEHDSDSD